MPVQDPLYEFATESPAAPVRVVNVVAPSPPTLIKPHIQAIDGRSRVVSFVLGFALATVFAWLGSLPGGEAIDQTAVAPTADPVASAVATVVAPATPEPARPLPQRTPPPAAPVSRPSPKPAVTTTPQPPPAVTAPPPQPKPAVSGYRGTLVLSSTPDGATVLMNGKVVGQTPVTLNDLPVGSRALIVRRDGYQSWSASVRVVADTRTPIRATLRPLPPSGG